MIRSRSEMTRLLRCGPAMTRSIASVNSSRPTVLRFLRAARIAASLTRFSRSAPENPGVCAAKPRPALAADGVDLVDEDDAWCIPLRLVEEIPHAAGADADEHLHELRPG